MCVFATGFGGSFVLRVVLPDTYLVAWRECLDRLGRFSEMRLQQRQELCQSVGCKDSVSTNPQCRFISVVNQLSCTVNLLSDSFSVDMLDTRLGFWLTAAT